MKAIELEGALSEEEKRRSFSLKFLVPGGEPRVSRSAAEIWESGPFAGMVRRVVVGGGWCQGVAAAGSFGVYDSRRQFS